MYGAGTGRVPRRSAAESALQWSGLGNLRPCNTRRRTLPAWPLACQRREVCMQKIEADIIQPGWDVWTSTGDKLGRVVRIEGSTIAVKKEGLLGGEVLVPRDAIRSVEERRVEVELPAGG
jgi:hypothetical protein